jgi:DMSO/TMAO reductase YedYZ molybdopterin-dependent catalytic subunit
LRRFFGPFLATFLILSAPMVAQQAAPQPAGLAISGEVTKPLQLSLADLSAMPHKSLKVTNPHDQKQEAYEGVPLADLLKLAGAAQGEQLRGTAMATYVLVEAADGYRAVFSLAELDPGIQDSNVLLADKVDGHALDGNIGPLRLVAPLDKRPARWVRMVQSIRVISAPK